jgi:hypothetical protein
MDFALSTNSCPCRKLNPGRVLGFKPASRLEWRGQDSKSEAEQGEHRPLRRGIADRKHPSLLFAAIFFQKQATSIGYCTCAHYFLRDSATSTRIRFSVHTTHCRNRPPTSVHRQFDRRRRVRQFAPARLVRRYPSDRTKTGRGKSGAIPSRHTDHRSWTGAPACPRGLARNLSTRNSLIACQRQL